MEAHHDKFNIKLQTFFFFCEFKEGLLIFHLTYILEESHKFTNSTSLLLTLTLMCQHEHELHMSLQNIFLYLSSPSDRLINFLFLFFNFIHSLFQQWSMLLKNLADDPCVAWVLYQFTLKYFIKN